MLSIIAAVSRNGVIGKDGMIPWNIPEDLAFFKKLTAGTTVVMGRKTFESIGRPLPGRENIIISSTKRFYGDNCTTAENFDDALKKSRGKDIFVCGGYSVYKEALRYAERLYITEIEASFDGDTFFPYFDKSLYTRTISSEHRNQYYDGFTPYRHVLYTRKFVTITPANGIYDDPAFMLWDKKN